MLKKYQIVKNLVKFYERKRKKKKTIECVLTAEPGLVEVAPGRGVIT